MKPLESDLPDNSPNCAELPGVVDDEHGSTHSMKNIAQVSHEPVDEVDTLLPHHVSDIS